MFFITCVYTSLTGQANLQDKVDTLQDKVVDLQDKLDTFQNTTEASTRKNQHEVVELLQNNTSSSLDGKILPYSQATTQAKLESVTSAKIKLQSVDKE